MEQIKIAFQQGELNYIDAIEALQKECGMTGKEAEAMVELWEEDGVGTLPVVSSAPVPSEQCGGNN